MGLVSQRTWREQVPDEDAWIEFRALSGTALSRARDAAQRKALALSATFSADQMAALRSMAEGAASPSAPLQYDDDTLLRESIIAWSYDAPVDIEDLDVRTSAWALDVIHDRNGLSETETDRKNGLLPSITG